MLASWIGALPPDGADQRREAAARAARSRGVESVAEVAWLDGVRATVRRDAAGLTAARQALRASGAPSATYLDRGLAAMHLAITGREVPAGIALANLEWELAQSSYRGVAEQQVFSAINRLAAVQWLLAGGD